MNILVVDDDVNSRVILRKLLENDNHGVTEASNGREAFRILDKDRPDLIISDVLMPEMDGFRLCLETRQNPSYRGIPFVFYTSAFPEEGDRRLARLLGASEYIVKPVNSKVFLDKIKRIVNDFSKGDVTVAPTVSEDMISIFRTYADRILHKLDSKVEELKAANENLTIAQRQWNHTFNSISDFVSIHDRDYRFVRVNNAFAGFLNKKPDELRGKFCYEVMHEMNSPWPDCPHTRVLETGEPSIIELNDPNLGCPLQVTAAPVFDNEGKLVEVVHIARDITHRKNREESLTQRQKRLSVLYRILSVLGRTLEIDRLLNTILNTLMSIDIFKIQKKGGIFIVEGEHLYLAAHTGHSEAFLRAHEHLKMGTCLCGLAARTGEVIIVRNSFHSSRHTIKYEGMEPHGHIIIPLRARGRVKGILYLYTPVNSYIDRGILSMLRVIGNQIGIALENALLYEETKKFSLHDPLTGIANRRYMNIVLERNFARAQRMEQSFSVIMADIDHFKHLNDTQGHDAGDKVLLKIAGLISREIRGMDLVVRYGGEEFLILLPETEIDEASEVSERIRRTIQDETDVTVSLGIAAYHEGIRSAAELIKEADNALYLAKKNGRNRVEISR